MGSRLPLPLPAYLVSHPLVLLLAGLVHHALHDGLQHAGAQHDVGAHVDHGAGGATGATEPE